VKVDGIVHFDPDVSIQVPKQNVLRASDHGTNVAEDLILTDIQRVGDLNF